MQDADTQNGNEKLTGILNWLRSENRERENRRRQNAYKAAAVGDIRAASRAKKEQK